VHNTIDLATLLERATAGYGDNTALIWENGSCTYGALRDRMHRLANALVNLGVRPGDRVGILFGNSPWFIESFWAAIACGAIVAPLNIRLTPVEMERVLTDCEPKVLIFDGEFNSLISNVLPTARFVESVICRGSLPGVYWEDYEDLLEKSPITWKQELFDPVSPCALYYTAGSTGSPKAAIRNHLAMSWIAFYRAMRHSENTVYLHSTPMFHTNSVSCAALLVAGGQTVIMRRFDADLYLDLIERYRVTDVSLRTTTAQRLLDSPKVYSFNGSSVLNISFAASPLTKTVRDGVFRIFPNANVTNGFGMTECSGMANHTISRENPKEPTCVGKPPPFAEVKIVDVVSDTEVHRGEIGEVVVRSAGMMDGYWRSPELTAETIRNGWLYTGDLGRQDEDGDLHLVGRKKDVIITGAENVRSLEVEAVIESMEEVLEVAVIGLPSREWGETVSAAVVPRKDSLTAQEIIQYCRSRLAGYKIPKSIFFLDSLPRNSNGKVARPLLKTMLIETGPVER
jgi:long-chain acyl-CoA synthetase